MSRKRNAWSYVDARDLGEIVRLAIEKDGLGFQVFNAVNDTITAELPTAEFLERPLIFDRGEGPSDDDGPFTPADKFFTTQHYGHPTIDASTFKLKITGLVNTAMDLSLDELKKLGSADLVAGFECSGNRGPLSALSGNGRWTGVPLKTVLDRAGVKANAREFVFFGADKGQEEVEFRTQKFTVEQQNGRSMPRDKALTPEPFLAYALNGQPLTRHQGSPLRLIVPGWYGAPNVKWLAEIVAQEDQYLGKFQARWYRTLKGEMINGEMKWVATSITHMQLKSYIARITKSGSSHKVTAVVLNDRFISLGEREREPRLWATAVWLPGASYGKLSEVNKQVGLSLS